MKILIIAGTRPEIIKVAPLLFNKFEGCNYRIHLCITGQHKELAEQAIIDFDLKMDDVTMLPFLRSKIPSEMFSTLMKNVGDFLKIYQPDMVLVHGDTMSTVVGALAAFYNRIPVGHIEAGLRSFNLTSPWPEEGNRKIVSSIADWHFCPTQSNATNLIEEGIDKQKVVITGNTIIDSLLNTSARLDEVPSLEQKIQEKYRSIDFNRRLILITTHRRENIGKQMINIFSAVKKRLFLGG